MKYADWIGSLKRRFHWLTLRFKWGRWHYQTNAWGDTLAAWWVWEK